MGETKIKTVLIARGAFEHMYEPAWQRSLCELGIKCELFNSHAYTMPGIIGRIERRVLIGYGVWKMRRSLIEKVKAKKPDVTLLYQGHYFDRKTIKRLKKYSLVVGYHNDDPFGPKKGILRYRHLHDAFPEYDGYHVYRQINLEEVQRVGVKNAAVLMSYYLPWMDYPRNLSALEKSQYECDLVFAGHYENDCRVKCLSMAVRSGINVKIYSRPERWCRALPKDINNVVMPRQNVVGDDYRNAICGAKIAACFFSKSNRDLYTRRVFEIPACGTLLLAERTPVMQSLYKEGKEADYFSSSEEFIDKLHFYLKHDHSRQRVAFAGLERVRLSGHDIYSRMRQWLKETSSWT